MGTTAAIVEMALRAALQTSASGSARAFVSTGSALEAGTPMRARASAQVIRRYLLPLLKQLVRAGITSCGEDLNSPRARAAQPGMLEPLVGFRH